MLPSGHFAAGYLTSKLAIGSIVPIYAQANDARFWAVGILASVLVDLDEFYAIRKIGRPIGENDAVNHRKFITHAPFLHLIIGAVGFILATLFGSTDFQIFAIMYVVGMWTHFFFDSFRYGIMWIWPFTNKLYAFRYTGKRMDIQGKTVLGYWKRFAVVYSRDFVFYLEALVIIGAIWVWR